MEVRPDDSVTAERQTTALTFQPQAASKGHKMRGRPARILLCVLPYLVFQPDAPVPGKTVRSFLAFPYGVLTMASYIKARANPSPEIQIVDLNLFATTAERVAELRRLLEQIRPQIVGFSMSYDISYNHVSYLTEEVKPIPLTNCDPGKLI